jgi:hypothetical protein
LTRLLPALYSSDIQGFIAAAARGRERAVQE